jgi:hypothetical protein
LAQRAQELWDFQQRLAFDARFGGADQSSFLRNMDTEAVAVVLCVCALPFYLSGFHTAPQTP